MADQFNSVWTRTPRRARTSGLDREQIVRAAVSILDKEGLDALSMRRLGAELDRKSTRQNSSHNTLSRMPSSA